MHLQKAIAPGTLAIKQPTNSVLKPIVEKSKPFLLAAAEGDRREGSGSRKGKQLMSNFQTSAKSNFSNQSQDTRDLNAEKKQATSKANLSVEISENFSSGNELLLTLDVCLGLERGPDGGWEVKWSKVKELGRLNKPKYNNKTYKPKAPFNAKPKISPKPIKAWRPKPKKTITNGETRTKETYLRLRRAQCEVPEDAMWLPS